MVNYTSDGGDELPEYKGFKLLYTQDPRDRGPGLLTYDDREYLLGLKDIEDASETQLRQRLRDRIRNGLLDFELLLFGLSEQDIGTIFSNTEDPSWPSESDTSKVYHGTEFALAFLYRGINDHTHANFQQLLESAIERGEQIRTEDGPGTHEKIPSASVNIEITWERLINEDHALERLRDGEHLSNQEIGALIRYDVLDEDDWELIRELQVDSE